MAQQADIEKDPFLALLTDALRAGPGSPEWREAVSRLKTAGDSADEYRLLIEAREALESGKEYRSVRAGPGFTRKLLTNLERERPAAGRSFPTAGIIALLAALVILIVVGVVVYELYPRGQVGDVSKAVDELASTYLPAEVLSATFENGVPLAWRKIGSLPVEASGGLRPGGESVSGAAYLGGGIVTANPLPAGQPFSLQVTLRIDHPGDDLIPQVFVSNSADFSQDRATSAQELVWQLQGKDQAVVVSGRVEGQVPLPAHTQALTVRLTLNRDVAIVETNNHRLWAGPHALGDAPRYVGVRFIRTGGKPAGDISIQSIRVHKS